LGEKGERKIRPILPRRGGESSQLAFLNREIGVSGENTRENLRVEEREKRGSQNQRGKSQNIKQGKKTIQKKLRSMGGAQALNQWV